MKPWWQSRTIWLAVLQVAAGVVAFALDNPGIGLAAIAKSALDIILRVVTTGPIGGESDAFSRPLGE